MDEARGKVMNENNLKKNSREPVPLSKFSISLFYFHYNDAFLSYIVQF